MSFLGAAFLLALPLTAAPLLLHLFDRRRNEVISWGAMQFLVDASAKKSSARRLKQWLLLLLRALVIAAMICALARPLLPTGYLGGSARGETIFVIDNSMSMSLLTHSDDGGSSQPANPNQTPEDLFDVAVARAIERLGELPNREDVRILTTSPYPEWVGAGPSRIARGGRQRIADQLSEIDTTLGRSDLLAALFAAIQVEPQPDQDSRRIIVLTDGQAADWHLEDTAGWKRIHEVLNDAPIRISVETARIDPSSSARKRGNLGIDELTMDRRVVGVGWPITAKAMLHNYDFTNTPSVNLTWHVDGQELDRQSIDSIERAQSQEANWQHTFDSAGTYRLSCHIENEDDLSADNTASLVVDVVDRIPIVIVESADHLAEMQQDSYFVQAALGWIHGKPLNASSIYVPTLVTPDELHTTDLSAQRVVVVPNLTSLPQEAISALSAFVSEGGGLWMGLGPRTDTDLYNHQLFADSSGLAPLRLDRIVDSVSPVAAADMDLESSNDPGPPRIDPFRSDHPAMRRLADSEQLDLSQVSIQRHFRFVTHDNANRLPVLIRLNDGTPLAVENNVGLGRVIVQGLPLRLQWSDLARTQAFVVMVRDWIDYLAAPRAIQYNLQPGQPIVYRVADSASAGVSTEQPDAATSGLLQMPRGEPIQLMAQSTDNGFEFRSSRTSLPGAYQLEIGLADRKVPFEVQRSEDESSPTRLDHESWQRIDHFVTANPSSEHVSQTASSHVDPVWPYLLLVVIGLIMGELILSGIMSRERFSSAGVPEFSEIDASLSDPPLGATVDRNRHDTNAPQPTGHRDVHLSSSEAH